MNTAYPMQNQVTEEICQAVKDTDEEMERLTKEAFQNRIDEFEPQIEFESKALTTAEAYEVLEDYELQGFKKEELTEPVDKDSILLHNEASDSYRVNNLEFQVIKVQINSDQLTPWDM